MGKGISNEMDLLIEGGRVVDPTQAIDRSARLLVIGGKVAAIDPPHDDLPSGIRSIDARGCIVAPGLIDLGTELREPGAEEDETIVSGCHAALAGGYTSILCAANTDPPIDTPAAVEFVRQKAARADACRVHVTACLSKGREGNQLAEIGLLVEAGAVAFSDAPRPVANSALLKLALEYCRMFDRPILDRPEVPELAGGGVMHQGEMALILGLNGLPTEAEDLAVARDLRLVEATSGRLHVGPISTIGSVDLIRRVKQRGLRVTASTSPHLLALLDSEFRSFDSSLKVNPPLRSAEHQQACIEALADGTIDCLVSGHTPRAREKKMADLHEAPFGMVTLTTSIALVHTSLILHDKLGWSDAIDRMSSAPARIAGIRGGSLRVGEAADIMIFDPQATWTVTPQSLRSMSINTPLLGRTLKGQVRQTIVGGAIKFGR
jgi:dihydroorotase